MFKTIQNAFKIPDLRKKIIFTSLMLVVFRIGTAIPVPGINVDIIKQMVEQQAGILSFYDIVAGGAFSNFTIFALSITPYITSSIVIQLLTVGIPALEDMQKSGEEGRKKILQYTRYLTVILALVQATAISIGFFNQALVSRSPLNMISVVLTLTAGTAFLMWLGEQITEKGIGNGISLIIFAGIVSRLPGATIQTFRLMGSGEINPLQVIVFLVISLLIIVGVIIVLQGVRKIPVQYAKRVVGRKTYGGQSTHIPLKVNQAGVIPVIFATSMLAFPQTLTIFITNPSYQAFVARWFTPAGSPGVYIYTALEFLMIIFFTYFYVSITFNPDEVADNMKNSSGFIPGIRPGKQTAEYLSTVLNRLTLAGAIFLALIASLPTLIYSVTNVPFRFGGTALLIVVGVAIETMKQIEAQMVMRHYQGFLK
ncbi:preprotein translocase subunit SecY [Acetoanaerobium pronyense]|uniref:Protein translocase subunit SecY n=1 Tax=Acetoanaerobium pronyense TaxID=1482736 RepID=A0ABS4KLL2_9FIRM|nr:preprotein translocase subunit SecY [Acetoanaerobium pronyense]MBP2028036.1 preprotein translocase subunit SecY [Acetoanaerobium pronyense]